MPASRSLPGEAKPLRKIVRPAGRAVFLHTSWRSAGTWLWECLRPLPDVCAYYEPLHEHLATLDAGRIATYSPQSWSSRHGPAPPYYREYSALLKLRLFGEAYGVAQYHARFAFERYFLQDDEADPELQRYIGHLLQSAAYVEQRPVLKFCRSLGRVGWMQHHFPDALHAVVIRHAVAQWVSAREQVLQGGNRYFLVAPCLVLARNSTHILVQEAAERFGLALPHLPEAASPIDHELCWRHMARLDWPARQRIFVAYWTVAAITSLASPRAAIIDVERLTAAAEYRLEVERMFGDAGYAVTLAPAQQVEPHTASLDADIHQAARALLHDQRLDGNAAALIEEKLGAGPTGIAVPRRQSAVASAPGLTQRLGLRAYWTTMRASMPLRRLHGGLVAAGKGRRRRG